MAVVEFLRGDRLPFVWQRAMFLADEVCVATYGLGSGQWAYDTLRQATYPRDAKLLVGSNDPFDSNHMTQANRIASLRDLEVRVLAGCHVKIVYTRQKQVHRAWIGSSNFVNSQYHELAVEFNGRQAHQLRDYFHQLWLRGIPVKPYDPKEVATSLSGSTF